MWQIIFGIVVGIGLMMFHPDIITNFIGCVAS